MTGGGTDWDDDDDDLERLYQSSQADNARLESQMSSCSRSRQQNSTLQPARQSSRRARALPVTSTSRSETPTLSKNKSTPSHRMKTRISLESSFNQSEKAEDVNRAALQQRIKADKKQASLESQSRSSNPAVLASSSREWQAGLKKNPPKTSKRQLKIFPTATEPAPSKRRVTDRRVKDVANLSTRASTGSLKREADSPDQSYVFPSNSRNELVDQHQTRQRKHQRLQVSPIRANIVSTPDREKRYDRTNDSSSRVELSIDDRCDAPLESTRRITDPESKTETNKTSESRMRNGLLCRFHSAVTSVEVMKELNEPTFGRTKKPGYDRIKKRTKNKRRPSPFDPAPIENIYLPSEGRDPSVHLNLLSNWQNFIIDEGHKEMNNSTDEIPQSWGWSASREDRKLGNDLRLSRVRTERTKNLLAELKRIDFDPDMDVLPRWRDCKNPCETSWNEIETESDDEQNNFQTSTQPNRFFKKMNSSDMKKNRSKCSFENYKSLFRPEEPEEEKKQETNPAKLKRIEDQNWDMIDDDTSRSYKEGYFCRSLKHGCDKNGRGRTTSDSFDVKEKNQRKKKTGEKSEKKADTKTLFVPKNIHKIMKDEEAMANDYNYRLGCEENYFERRKKPRNVLRSRVWQYCKDFGRYAAESIYDNPDYDDRHELKNHLNLFDSQYLGLFPGDKIATEFIRDKRIDETVGYYDDEQTGEEFVDFKNDEEGHFYGVSFKEGNNWANMDLIVRDMVSALVRETFKSLQELETDIVSTNSRFFEKMAYNQTWKTAAIELKGRAHTGLEHITMLLKIAADLALAKIEVRLELTSNQSFTSFYKALMFIGRPQVIVPFVRREDWNGFVEAVLGFLTVLLGNPTVCMCDPSDPYFDEIFPKLGAQFWASIYKWVIYLVAYGFKYNDSEYLDFLKPRLITFVRVYENCQYQRYRARKNYNLSYYKDVVEYNLEADAFKELDSDQREFLDSLDLTNPVDSLHETEKHRTHGLLHVIEKLTSLGSIPYSNYIFKLWGRSDNPRATYESFNFSQKHDHLIQTQWSRHVYRRFFPMAEYKLDNVASHQFVEFYIEALANLKKVLPENCEKILKDGPCKKEHIEALRPFAHCVQQITDIATLSLRASIGVTGLLEKKLDAFADDEYAPEDKEIIEAERECLEFGYADQLQKVRFKLRLMIKPIEELIEPYMVFLPAQVRYNWDRFHNIAFPILRENGRGVHLPPRSREERAPTRSRTPKKPNIKKYIVLSRALARNEKEVVKNYNSVLHKKEQLPDI